MINVKTLNFKKSLYHWHDHGLCILRLLFLKNTKITNDYVARAQMAMVKWDGGVLIYNIKTVLIQWNT